MSPDGDGGSASVSPIRAPRWLAAGGIAGATAAPIAGARAQGSAPPPGAGTETGTGAALHVRAFGAAGDGRTIDTPAVNRAIGAARSRRSKGLCKARHSVEDFVAELRQYRAIAPGQDERPAHFLGAIYLTGIATWLNWGRALDQRRARPGAIAPRGRGEAWTGRPTPIPSRPGSGWRASRG